MIKEDVHVPPPLWYHALTPTDGLNSNISFFCVCNYKLYIERRGFFGAKAFKGRLMIGQYVMKGQHEPSTGLGKYLESQNWNI